MREAEHPRPTRVIAHLSDLHIRPPGSPLVRGIVDPLPHLLNALGFIESSGFAPDALLFTGDLTDDGSPEAYAVLADAVRPVAARLGAQVIWVNGNHDARGAFRAGLLGEPASEEPINQVHWLGGLRLLCLDTNVPGEDWGRVEPESLTWLGQELEASAEEGSLLLLHHSPLPCVQDLAVSWELLDQDALATIVRHSDIRAILGGHFHQSSFGSFAGIPVSSATSICQTQDLHLGRGIRGHDGAQAWNLVQVYADSVLHTVAPLATHTTVIEPRTADQSADALAELGIAIPSQA